MIIIRLGIFWFVPDPDNGARLIEESVLASEIPVIGGFKTYDPGHVDVWKKIVQREPSLIGHPYEDYPRGRANWRAEDDAWLLLMDKTVMRAPFISAVQQTWNLPKETVVMSDSHYRCRIKVSPPVGTGNTKN